jgi:hypothetical protein
MGFRHDPFSSKLKVDSLKASFATSSVSYHLEKRLQRRIAPRLRPETVIRRPGWAKTPLCRVGIA